MTPGKEADIIGVDLFTPHSVPFFMETQRLAYFAKGSDVQTVMVQGQVLMEDRKVLSVNEDDVLDCRRVSSLPGVGQRQIGGRSILLRHRRVTSTPLARTQSTCRFISATYLNSRMARELPQPHTCTRISG